MSSTAYPTLFAMAMDYLPIQASAVSCERVFSSSINPELMESLQMLKYHLKKEYLNFTEDWALKEKELIEDAPEEDLLHMLVAEDSQNAMDRVMRTIEHYESV
jgi:hypothetical protein